MFIFTLAISCLTTSNLLWFIHGSNSPGSYTILEASQVAHSNESVCIAGDPGLILETEPGKIPWRRAWQVTSVILSGEFHGQRSLQDTVHGVAMFFTALVFTCTTRHIHSWALLPRSPSLLILSGAIPLLLLSSILDSFQPGGLILQCHSFLPFHTVHGVFKERYWSGMPSPPPLGHIFSELFSITHLSCMALHSMAHRSIEFCKPLHHNKAVIHEGEICT